MVLQLVSSCYACTYEESHNRWISSFIVWVPHQRSSVTIQRPNNASPHLYNTKLYYPVPLVMTRQYQAISIYEPRREPLVVAISPRPAAEEAAANSLPAAPPTLPSSTVGSVATTSLGAVATFRTGPVPDDAAFAGAAFLVLVVVAAGPLSRRLMVFSFSGARRSLASSTAGFGLALGWTSESRSSPASPDVRFDARRRVVLLAVPVRRGAGAVVLVLLGSGGLKTTAGNEAVGSVTGGCKDSGASTVATGGARARCSGGSTTGAFENTGLGLGSRAGGRRAGKETGTCTGPGADAWVGGEPSGESASKRIRLSGLGLAGEYACATLRDRDLASGNGFDVGKAGRSVILSSSPRTVTSGARDSPVEEGTVNGGGNGGVVVDGKRSGTDGTSSEGGWGGRRDSGEGGGSTKEVGRSEAGTMEGFTSVSKEASTRLLVIRLGREPEASRFADTDDLIVLKGDLWFSFPLDLERVLRGERRDGPGTGAGAPFASKGTGAADSSAFFVMYSLSVGFQINEQRHRP